MYQGICNFLYFATLYTSSMIFSGSISLTNVRGDLFGAYGGIRTRTATVLSRMTLPIGLRRQIWGSMCKIKTNTWKRNNYVIDPQKKGGMLWERLIYRSRSSYEIRIIYTRISIRVVVPATGLEPVIFRVWTERFLHLSYAGMMGSWVTPQHKFQSKGGYSMLPWWMRRSDSNR